MLHHTHQSHAPATRTSHTHQPHAPATHTSHTHQPHAPALDGVICGMVCKGRERDAEQMRHELQEVCSALDALHQTIRRGFDRLHRKGGTEHLAHGGSGRRSQLYVAPKQSLWCSNLGTRHPLAAMTAWWAGGSDAADNSRPVSAHPAGTARVGSLEVG